MTKKRAFMLKLRLLIERIVILTGVYLLSSLIFTFWYYLTTKRSFSHITFNYLDAWLVILKGLFIPDYTFIWQEYLIIIIVILFMLVYLVRPNKITISVSILAILFWQFIAFTGLFVGV